jgi:hypothetical protein
MALSNSTPLVVLTGRENARRLHGAGVLDLEWLLRIACTPEGRAQLAIHTRISEAQLLGWAHGADLCRVAGIDMPTAALLQQVGVRTLRDLVAADAHGLGVALRNLSPQCDSGSRRVAAWIRSARTLQPAVHDEAPPPGSAWEAGASSRPVERIEVLRSASPWGKE